MDFEQLDIPARHPYVDGVVTILLLLIVLYLFLPMLIAIVVIGGELFMYGAVCFIESLESAWHRAWHRPKLAKRPMTNMAKLIFLIMFLLCFFLNPWIEGFIFSNIVLAITPLPR